jgi:tetratricopeptide (TPR) repeat protein
MKWLDKFMKRTPMIAPHSKGSHQDDASTPPASAGVEPISGMIERAYRSKDMRRPAEALSIFQAALARDSEDCGVLNGLGLVYLDLAMPLEALSHFKQALEVNPDHLSSLCNSASVLTSLGQPQEAIRNCERALSIKADFEPALVPLAFAYNSLGRHEEALVICDRLVRAYPDRSQLRRNRALTLQDMGRFNEALSDFRAIVELDPSDRQARHSLALNSLLCGDFTTGWREHEARWASGNVVHPLAGRQLKAPWDGKRDLSGKTILLYAEQGHGDTIQFSRYCRLVKARGARVLLGVPAPLRPIFKDLEGVDELIPDHQELPDFDEQSPLMSLPLAFETRLDTIPEQATALAASPAKIADWQTRLGEADRLRIAISWKGNPSHAADAARSIALEEFSALFLLPFDFVSVQFGVTSAEQSILRDFPNVRDVGSQINDFEDSSALIACCDLVISVDSAPAHLAGAMGKPCWILITYRPDWRWLLDRGDSPWYSSVRLFRQPRPGDWRSVFEFVKRDLAAL